MRRGVLTLAGLTAFVLSMSEAVSFGKSQQDAQASVYLAEGFDGGSMPGGWTAHRVVGTSATWAVVGVGTNPPVPPRSGSGQAKFNSYDASLGEQARLVSPALDLSSSTDPFAEFFMYHDTEFAESADSLCVELSTADSVLGPWITLLRVARPRATSGWLKAAVSLSSAKGLARAFVAFRGVSRYGNNIYLDDVRVLDSTFHDIGAVAFVSNMLTAARGTETRNAQRSGPDMSVTGLYPSATLFLAKSVLSNPQGLSVHVVVENFGTYPEPSYSAQWSVDGQTQPPVDNVRVLGRGERDTLLLPWPAPSPGWHQIVAWTYLPSDSNRVNDTVRTGVQILDSTVVSHEFFNEDEFPPLGWTVVNRDGGPEEAWFSGSSVSVFVPFEGAGFAADNFQRANGSYLDDYLISSPVPNIGSPGARDSLVFWVRSAYALPPAANYPDSLMILLSLGGSDTADFSVMLDYFSVPKGIWSRRGYELTGVIPENSTIRAAFRYLHFDAGTSGANADFVGIDGVQFTHAVVTSVRENRLPEAFALHQNFPNPFNPSTTLKFDLPHRAPVRLTVVDILGRQVSVLLDETREAGSYVVAWQTGGQASGVYFCRMDTPGSVQTRKMMLLK